MLLVLPHTEASVINPGVGYTPSSGFLVYTDIPLVTQTGEGSGAIANVVVNNGEVGFVTITNGGGKNYARGRHSWNWNIRSWKRKWCSCFRWSYY